MIKIKIVHTVNGKYVPYAKIFLFWIRVSEFDFDHHKACINWLRKAYIPELQKSKSATYFQTESIYIFHPDYRDQIDKDFN